MAQSSFFKFSSQCNWDMQFLSCNPKQVVVKGKKSTWWINPCSCQGLNAGPPNYIWNASWPWQRTFLSFPSSLLGGAHPPYWENWVYRACMEGNTPCEKSIPYPEVWTWTPKLYFYIKGTFFHWASRPGQIMFLLVRKMKRKISISLSSKVRKKRKLFFASKWPDNWLLEIWKFIYKFQTLAVR